MEKQLYISLETPNCLAAFKLCFLLLTGYNYLQEFTAIEGMLYFIVIHLHFLFCSQCEMRTEARRKNLLILILHYLTQEGYVALQIFTEMIPLFL